MKLLAVLLITFSIGIFESHAHEGHDHDLKASEPLTDTSIWQLGSTWKNQKGETVTLASLNGKPRLVAMLYTRCKTACPLLVEDIKKIASELKKEQGSVDVAIFSLDSAQETPDSLSEFAKKRALPAHWQLLTSNAGAVAELAGALGVRYKKLKDGEFIHSNVIYFLNNNGDILAEKEGLKTPSDDFLKKIRDGLK